MTDRSNGFVGGLKAPASWAAIAVVLILEWLFWIWFHPPIGMSLVAISLGVGLFAGWIAWLSRSIRLAQRRVDLARSEQKLRRLTSEQLATDLRDVDSEKGILQLDSILQKFEMLVDALEHRLRSGDLTYIRHLGSAERILISTLDNLDGIASSLHDIGRAGQCAPDRSEQEKGIAPRRARVQHLYSENEQAIAAFYQAATALTEPPLSGKRTSLRSAFDNLDRLSTYREQPPTTGHH